MLLSQPARSARYLVTTCKQVLANGAVVRVRSQVSVQCYSTAPSFSFGDRYARAPFPACSSHFAVRGGGHGATPGHQSYTGRKEAGGPTSAFQGRKENHRQEVGPAAGRWQEDH